MTFAVRQTEGRPIAISDSHCHWIADAAGAEMFPIVQCTGGNNDAQKKFDVSVCYGLLVGHGRASDACFGAAGGRTR